MEYMTAMSGRTAFELGAQLGAMGVLALGAEGSLSWMLARAAGCGASLAGADVLFHDGTTPASGAWLAHHYGLPASLYFMEENGRSAVWLHDGQGQRIDRSKLPQSADWAGPVGTWDRLAGVDSSYAAHRVREIRANNMRVTVMPGQGQTALIKALERMGCEVLSRPRVGVPILQCDRSGFRLAIRDGLDSREQHGQDALAAAVEWCPLRQQEQHAIPAFGPDGETRQL